MAEFYINLYEQQDKSGNKPHYRALMTIGGEKHECAFWPNKDGKAGFSGKVKPKDGFVTAETVKPETRQMIDKMVADVNNDEIPF